MSVYEEPIREASLAMMERVFENECRCRAIRRDSSEGEELARVIMHSFLGGITEERELMVLAHDLVD
jgi:hypothetical protein